MKELELAEKEGSVIASDLVRSDLLRWTSIFVKGLDALKKKLPILLSNVSQDEFYEIISSEIEKLRKNICQLPDNKSVDSLTL